MVSKAKSLGMPAVGLTDHGTVAGLIVFLRECRKQGIKPIMGMEGYLCRDHRCHSKNDVEIKDESGDVIETIKGQPDGRKGNRHINIIAKNYKGFQNLCELSQISSLEGYYYDPRIDLSLLDKHKEGLIVTSACLSNIINWLLSRDQYSMARKAASGFVDIFGEDFYLEMMFHGIGREAKILPDIQKLAKDLGIKVIVTNDCHYVNQKDAEFHEYLMCMSSGRCVRDPSRIKFPYDEFYFKSEQEMKKLFGHCPRSMMNTLEIAEKCDYSEILFVEEGGTMKLPKFDLPEGHTPLSYLEKIAKEGLEREGWHNSRPHVERLNRELDDVRLIWNTKRYDFATYFLIVEDIMRFAKNSSIDAGVRGSGYGSVLLKCLGITEGIDPLKYDLLWERFLGFDDAYFISENDFGIAGYADFSKANNADYDDSTDASDPVVIMSDRYE